MALIRSNKYNMDHLFSNLISNAIKYTTKEGKVTISIKDRGGNIELWVSDTGIGIPQTDLPNIFNEFYRGTNAKAHAFKGTGLGLSIVKRIVQIQGGKIGIESDVGKGTTVNVLLPKENMPSLES
jgi:signal transduction histidine kinase